MTLMANLWKINMMASVPEPLVNKRERPGCICDDSEYGDKPLGIREVYLNARHSKKQERMSQHEQCLISPARFNICG